MTEMFTNLIECLLATRQALYTWTCMLYSTKAERWHVGAVLAMELLGVL